MDQKQPATPAEIISFPNAPRMDDRLLEMILNNMPQGVALFDAETQLIFCNRRYMELYGMLPEFSRPGRHLRDLLIQRIQNGTFSEDPDEYITRLKECIAAGEAFNHTVHLSDGRAFAVASKPIAEGGWLATHEDITERQRSEGRIAHMARHDALTDLPNRVHVATNDWSTNLNASNAVNVWRSFASIWINSRASTMRLAIRSATSC